MNINQKQSQEYLSMIDYLISNLNKAKLSPPSLSNNQKSLPIFLYEFFVFELYLPRDLIRIIKQPILAFRLLDFPTLTLEGNVNLSKETIYFNQGKSSFFEMDLGQLKDNLINQPMYIMFLDLNHGNMKIIGNCRLNISIFAYDSFLNFDKSSKGPQPRRNILQLFDNSMEKVGEFEISLLIRREYYKFDKNIEIDEKKKTFLIKKLKKNKEKYQKDKNEQFFISGLQKPKDVTKNFDNNFYYNKNLSNNEYDQKQPQYVNNFILEGKDTAFNAHPVNKVITIRSQSQSHTQSRTQNEGTKKGKKRKKSKRSIQTETDLLPGVNVPINNIDYNKNSKRTQNINKKGYSKNISNRMNNNQQLIDSMYNKVQKTTQYNLPYNNSDSFNYNNSNNNFYNPNGSNFNNNIYGNNKNIDSNMLYNQTNGMKTNLNNQNISPQINYINQNNISYNNNSNITNKSEPNEYLKLVTELKSKVSAYKDKLINEQKNIQKIKEKRNINSNLDMDLLNPNKDNENVNDNNDNNKNENFDEYNNNSINKDNENNNDNYSNNDNNDNEDNNDYNNKFNNYNENNDIHNNSNNLENNNDNQVNNDANKFNNIDNNLNDKNANSSEIEEYKSDFQNISESQSNILPHKGSAENFASSSFGINSQNFQKEDKKTNNIEKQNTTIKEEEYNDFQSNISEKKENKSLEIPEESALNKNQNKNESEIPEESIIQKTNKNKQESNIPPRMSEEENYNYKESEIQIDPSANKYNNYNYEINNDKNQIKESIIEENNKISEKEINIASQSEIKEDTSIMKYNNLQNNETQLMNKYGSGEIPEDINEDFNARKNNIRNSSKKEGRSGSENKISYGKSGDTDEIEEDLLNS